MLLFATKQTDRYSFFSQGTIWVEALLGAHCPWITATEDKHYSSIIEELPKCGGGAYVHGAHVYCNVTNRLLHADWLVGAETLVRQEALRMEMVPYRRCCTCL